MVSYKNQLSIGMLFGSGIWFGIGMLAQPDNTNIRVTARVAKRMALLGLFLKSEVSPVYLYDPAQHDGFSQAFPTLF